MKNLKTLLLGATFAIVFILIGAFVFRGSMWGNFGNGFFPMGSGMMYGGGYGNFQNREFYKQMNDMHSLMWKNENLTEREFEELKKVQKEYMGFSWFDDLENVDEFNEARKNFSSNGYYRMGPGMMWDENYMSTPTTNKKSDSVETQNNKDEISNSEEGIREIKITAKRFEYSPSEITLKKGEKVKLVIDNVDFVHGLHFEDLPGEPGDNYEYIFEATEVGEFEFHCNRFCGAGHEQMEGKIIVVK